jgi:hypothetical protein
MKKFAEEIELFKTHARLPVYTKKRNDQSDYDYLKRLSNKDLEWLMRFHCEYVNASKKHPGRRLHRTKKLFRTLYDKNNCNNRCMYTLAKVLGLLSLGNDVPEYDPRFAPSLTEDYMISLIDNRII